MSDQDHLDLIAILQRTRTVVLLLTISSILQAAALVALGLSMLK